MGKVTTLMCGLSRLCRDLEYGSVVERQQAVNTSSSVNEDRAQCLRFCERPQVSLAITVSIIEPLVAD